MSFVAGFLADSTVLKVVTYFLITFIISWGGVLAAVGFDGFPGTPDSFTSSIVVVVAAMLLGPSLSSIITTTLFNRSTGLRELWQHFLTTHVSVRWYALALFTAPVVVNIVLVALSTTSAVFRPGVFSVDSPLPHVVIGIATGAAAGFFEELGWTGVAIPELRKRLSMFKTGLVVGLVWGLWHVLVVWWGSGETAGIVPTSLYVPAMSFVFLVPYRILMVWVHDRTHSLLIAMLMHGSLTASVRIFDPVPISDWPIIQYNVLLGAGFCLAVIVVFFFSRLRPRLER